MGMLLKCFSHLMRAWRKLLPAEVKASLPAMRFHAQLCMKCTHGSLMQKPQGVHRASCAPALRCQLHGAQVGPPKHAHTLRASSR